MHFEIGREKDTKSRMIKSVYIFLLFFLLFLPSNYACGFRISGPAPGLVPEAHALDIPILRGYVNDYAGMISPSARSEIERELKSFEASDSTQIIILTIPSLEGESLEDYSIRVADAWKIGQKGKDNGALFLVARDDRKIRIEVGRGLEGRLTDLMAGRVIDLVIKPRFKRGDFDGGFISGVHSMIDATRGEFKAEKRVTKSKSNRVGTLFTVVLAGGILLTFIGAFSRVAAGISGALGLPAVIYLLFLPIGLVALIILAIIGFLAGFFMTGGGRRGGGTYYGTHGGGFLGGGGWSSSSGGGFSGGGGGFGGGGSSGSW